MYMYIEKLKNKQFNIHKYILNWLIYIYLF